MDFFKFNPVTSPSKLENGQFLNGILKYSWVERYDEIGEFTFEARVSSGLGGELPIDTLISHTETLEVMIVENQEIQETEDEDPIILISGRSFVSWLENRYVGVNLARAGSQTIAPYILPSDNTWIQAANLITGHITDGQNIDDDDSLEDVGAGAPIGGPGLGIEEERLVEPGTVLERVLEIIKIESHGIRTIRRNGFYGSEAATTIQVYRGTDRTADVMFSWEGGDLANVNYLLSNKKNKNSAFVVGQYLWVIVDTTGVEYERRMMLVDARDIDGAAGSAPTGTDLTDAIAAMETRGREAIANQNRIIIQQADVGENSRYKYRRDYGLGDLVSVDGNYNQMAIMRVVEYAEIGDENGISGHPTLALPIEEI